MINARRLTKFFWAIFRCFFHVHIRIADWWFSWWSPWRSWTRPTTTRTHYFVFVFASIIFIKTKQLITFNVAFMMALMSFQNLNLFSLCMICLFGYRLKRHKNWLCSCLFYCRLSAVCDSSDCSCDEVFENLLPLSAHLIFTTFTEWLDGCAFCPDFPWKINAQPFHSNILGGNLHCSYFAFTFCERRNGCFICGALNYFRNADMLTPLNY